MGSLQSDFSITFQTSHPWSFSPVYKSEIYDLSLNTVDGTVIQLKNSGDLPLQPIITVQLISETDFSIQNLSDSGKYLSFSGLQPNETITIDIENEDIQSDAQFYRFNNMLGEYISFPRGVNNLLIKGNIKIQFTYEFRILA
jgi:phage-related protein